MSLVKNNCSVKCRRHLSGGGAVATYTGGYFAYEETVSACLPSTSENESISIATAALSINDDTIATTSMVNELMVYWIIVCLLYQSKKLLAFQLSYILFILQLYYHPKFLQ